MIACCCSMAGTKACWNCPQHQNISWPDQVNYTDLGWNPFPWIAGGKLLKINKVCAVIVAAYKADKFIRECVQSIQNQTARDGWYIDIRIGVDGCPATANELDGRVPYYWSPQNVGAYLMRNALIYAEPADAYAYFDADDVMFPDYIARALDVINSGADAVMAAKINCDADLIPLRGSRIENGGAITFTYKALEAVGGFYRHRVAGDTDFMRRLEMAGIRIAELNDPLYYRRRHAGALTKKSDTGIGSPYRKKVWAEMCRNRERGIVKIVPTVIKLEKK